VQHCYIRLGQLDGGRLDECLRETFQAARSPRRSKLSGRLRRELPTTLAAMEFQVVGRRDASVTAHWAGDSRCYVLTPKEGLRQLSRDDSDVHDALETLIADQPMTNLISASSDFRINTRSETVQLPCVLVCATDGFYNYVSTPAHFELVLLDAISTGDPLRMGERLKQLVRGYTQDDASLAMILLGFKSPSSEFRSRWRGLEMHHQVRTDTTREDFVRDREASWLRYRDEYSYYLREEIQ
jgi:serine/threonine protein phosphatase PrpC